MPAAKISLSEVDEPQVIAPPSAEKPAPKKRRLQQPKASATEWAAQFGAVGLVRSAQWSIVLTALQALNTDMG